MANTRRDLLRRGAAGLAALGFGGLLLRADAEPTPESGELGDYGKYLAEPPPAPAAATKEWAPTEDNILGPFHRPGAPFRAKVTPPLEPGTVLLVSGRVFAHDTRKPLGAAVLDIWQANDQGRYDNDDPRNPPRKGVYVNRARLLTDENGHYEYETILPGRYKIGPEQWRPRHIHYLVRAEGYKNLVTQLYFKGDPHNATDPFIKESLIIETAQAGNGDRAYQTGAFDVVLAKA